jgi:hypothetical protein
MVGAGLGLSTDLMTGVMLVLVFVAGVAGMLLVDFDCTLTVAGSVAGSGDAEALDKG